MSRKGEYVLIHVSDTMCIYGIDYYVQQESPEPKYSRKNLFT